MSDSSGESKDASTFVPFDVQEEIRNLRAVRELFRVINEGYNIETRKTLETEFKSALVALQSLTGHEELKDAVLYLVKKIVPILMASALAMRGIDNEIVDIQTNANALAEENEDVRKLRAVHELFRVIKEGGNGKSEETLKTEFDSALVALTGHEELKEAIQHLTEEEVPIRIASAFAMRGIDNEIVDIQTNANVRAGENIRDLVTEDELSEDEEA
jgi:soluble P-type ATPase